MSENNLHERYLRTHKLYEEFWMVDGKKHTEVKRQYDSVMKELIKVCQQIVDVLIPDKYDVTHVFFQNKSYYANVFFRDNNWDGTQLRIPLFLMFPSLC